MALLGVLLTFLVLVNRGSAGQHANQTGSSPSYKHKDAVMSLADSNNKFTMNLYMQLGKKPGNLFYSPFSIMAALGMAYAGAGGNTEKQMRSIMHLSEDKEVTQNGFGDIMSDLKRDSKDYELRTFNMAFVKQGISLRSQYSEVLKSVYHSTVNSVDLKDEEKLRQKINAEVEKATKSRIKDLLPSGILDLNTMMVLVNAVYFKGFWVHTFKPTSTRDQEFWTSNKSSIKVPMMHETKSYQYYHDKDLGAKMLRMDYEGDRFGMVFVLPEKRDGLAEVEAKLAKANLNELAKKMQVARVQVTIPKMKLEKSLFLKDDLSEMGMKDLFRGSADLSGISGSKGIYVSKMFHKAFLEVNENGTEAAAATALVSEVRSCKKSFTFTADHPFLFYIRDLHTGLIYFMGRLVKL